MKKYQSTFTFVDTQEEAESFADSIGSRYTPYMRKRYGEPYYHLWKSLDGKEVKYIVWYYM